MVIPINKTTKVESKLSLDGKMLEITLKDTAFLLHAEQIQKEKLLLTQDMEDRNPEP